MSDSERTVLYVEDDPLNIALVKMILTRRPGVTLVVAKRGGLAVELACRHEPALILLDLHLPDVSGETVLGRLRGDPRTADIPIVAVSADATPSQVARLLGLGATDYLAKPFGFECLLAVIDGKPASAQAKSMPPVLGPQAPAVLDPVAIAALHKLASGPNVDASAVRDLVRVFLSDAREQLAALENGPDPEDLPNIACQAHALRGASGGVGAAGLTGLCRRLEVAAKDGDVARVQSVLPRLRQALTDARSALTVEFHLDEQGR
jgi:CheY-like chemotaxis protein